MNTADIYGDFKVIDIEKKHPNPHCTVMCTICGRTQNLLQSAVRKRNNTHGNICSKIVIRERFKSNSHKSQFYRIWRNMRTRTTNENYEKKQHYSQKGIDSEEFKYFVDFYDQMYKSYKEHIKLFGEDNTTLDRIDNSKSYSTENCRWATWLEQANNKTSNLKFKARNPKGQIFTGCNLKKFCENENIDYSTVISGIHQHNKSWESGWYFEVV